ARVGGGVVCGACSVRVGQEWSSTIPDRQRFPRQHIPVSLPVRSQRFIRQNARAVREPLAHSAGNIVALTLPNPTRYPLPWHQPVIVTRSPSCKNDLVCPPASATGFVPRHDNSSILPNESAAGPLIVPDANRSPGRKLQPLIV